jgi:predicted DCC family thiol-disulfide oxidoreductase YuxK
MIPAPLILYDGVCNLCNRWVQFVLKHDRRQQFHFAPLQGTTAKKLLAEKKQLHEFPDTVILFDNNNIYTGSGAALRIFKKLGKGWKLIYGLIVFPPFIRDGVYRFIANRRYKWFGKTDSCILPPEKWKRRFLD